MFSICNHAQSAKNNWWRHWLGLAVLLVASKSFAAQVPLRVTTWNMQEPAVSATNAATGRTADERIQEAAEALKKLNPEVIVLQQVRDWQMCGQLAQALRPAEYNVLVCSSFRDTRTGAASKQQVAILAKRKSYFAWSEAWRAEGQGGGAGGFAFAAMRAGKQKVGVFAVQLGDRSAQPGADGPDAAVAQAQAARIQQWSQKIDSLKHWVTNRIEAAIVSGAFNVDPAVPESSGAELPLTVNDSRFADALLRGSLAEPLALPDSTGADYLMAHLVANADTLRGVILDRCPATCDLDFVPTKPVPVAIVRNETPPTKPPPAKAEIDQVPATETKVQTPIAQTAKPPQTVQVAETGAKGLPLWTAGAAIGVLLLVALVWAVARRRPVLVAQSPTLIALSSDRGGGMSSSDTVVITQRSVTGSATEDYSHAPPGRPVIQLESAGTTQSESEEWRRRALAAEEQAQRATAVVRTGLIPHLSHWLKQKLVRRLISDRSDLLETQHAATLRALAVDERLSRIELQINQQNMAYERRIDELMRELATAKEENRELIRAKIAQVKMEMEAARMKMFQQAKDGA